MAVFSRLLPLVTSAYGLQTLLALIFVPQQNDKYYDLGGAIGFLSTTFLSLYYPALKAKYYNGIPGAVLPALSTFAPRQLLITAVLGIWSLRLGTFLTARAIKAKGDSRFDKIKTRPKSFTIYWIMQATWTTLVGLPVYLCNILPPAFHPALGFRDFAALGLIVGSFLFEATADRQKSVWRHRRDNKLHDEKFITSGLWSISRHPNYVGEVGIWTGIWALSTASLQSAYFPRGSAVALAALSPVVAWHLTRNLSGVPPLERKGDNMFGDDPKWQEYKRTVPIYWPWGSTN